jgi:hypothetical protein
MLRFNIKSLKRNIGKLYNSSFGDVPTKVILSQGNVFILIISLFLLLHEVFNIKLTSNFFYTLPLGWVVFIGGVYIGIFLKVQHTLLKESEYNIGYKRDIEGCKVVCEEWGGWTIGVYDYTANSLLLPEKQAALLAKSQNKYLHNMVTLENPVEIIINSNNTYGYYTLIISSTYKANITINKFKNGADLSKLGFFKRG